MSSDRLATRIEKKVTRSVWDLCEHYGVTVPKFSIHWDLVGDELLGTATADRLVRLNPMYLQAIGITYEQTAMHEAAHIVTSRRGAQRHANLSLDWSDHGNEWAQAMRVLGAEVVPHASSAEMTLAAANMPR